MEKQYKQLKDVRQFGIVLSGILLVFGTILCLKGRAGWYHSLLGLGLITLILVLITPQSIKPVYAIFTKIAHAIGWFNTRAILCFIYFIFVTPIGLIMKLLGNDPLNNKSNKNGTTYWTGRSLSRPNKEQLQKQF